MEYNYILTQSYTICRTCLGATKDCKSSLTMLDSNNRSLRDLLVFLTNIDINMNEKYPNRICSECYDMLCKAESFKKQCIQSENVLNKVFNDSEDVKQSVKKELVIPKVPETEIYNCELIKLDNSNLPCLNYKTEEPPKCELWNSSHEENNDISTTYASRQSCNDNNLSVPKQEKELSDGSEMAYDFNECSPSHECSSEMEIPVEIKLQKKELPITFSPTTQTDCKEKTKDSKFISNKCPKCNLTFTTFSLLESHVRIHKNDTNVQKQYQCSLCMRKFTEKKSLVKHIKRHESRDNIQFKCNTCKRDFQHKAHLDNHILSVHTRKHGYKCEICQKSFSTKDSLVTHQESHNVEKLHQCKTCGKSFVMLSSLTDHLRTHTGEKPYLCSICGRGFSQNTNLQQHVRRHMGIKPFKCEQCEQGFVSKGELVAHQRKHSGAHPFVCEDCGNGFTTSSSLVKHRRLHTGERPFACDFCSMRFNASGTLKNHRRTHTGEKPYQCSHCEKAFIQRQDLIAHIRCHTGERPFICTSCGQAFRKASALKAHVKIHGKETLQRYCIK